MSKAFFSFKKFKVYHDRCAMKVGTDGVLLGAWTDIENVLDVLDVGTGTGLISMMLAQRLGDSRVCIDAIDIDYEAIFQARSNIIEAGFGNIQVSCHSLQNYANYTDRRYDLIVSNPPFFSTSLQSPDSKRTLARHAASLTAKELLSCTQKLLTPKGRLSVIYPYDYKSKLVTLADQLDLKIVRMTNVFPTPVSEPKRILMEFSTEYIPFKEDNLVIELQRHIYSLEFTQLVKDFYLKL